MCSFIVLCLCAILSKVSTLEIIPERANVTYFNPDYIKWINVTVTRFGRRSPYFFNMEGEIKHAWGNNISVNLIFYEYLSNEYRRSFVEFHFGLCDLIEREAYIGGLLAMGLAGKTCPYPPGEYRLVNLTVPTSKVNFVWPFSRARVDVYGLQKRKNETIVTGSVYVTLK